MNGVQTMDNYKLLPLRSFAKEGPYTLAYLSNLVQRKKLKAKRIGRNYFSSWAWFNEYMEKHGRAISPAKTLEKKLLPLRMLAGKGPYSLSYLSNLVQRKKLKAEKIGRNYFSSEEWLSEYLESHAQDRVRENLAPATGQNFSGRARAAEAGISIDDLSEKIVSRIMATAAEPQKKKKLIFAKFWPKRVTSRLALIALLTIFFSCLISAASPNAAGNLVKLADYVYFYPLFKISDWVNSEPEIQNGKEIGHAENGLKIVAGEKEYAPDKFTLNFNAKGAGAPNESIVSRNFVPDQKKSKEEARQALEYYGWLFGKIKTGITENGKKVYLALLQFINPIELDEPGGVLPEPATGLSKEDEDESGSLVVPFKNKEQADELRQKVNSMFSDEVVVTPDESGRSGIIKPVFGGETGSQEYLYMMVPVNEEDKK